MWKTHQFYESLNKFTTNLEESFAHEMSFFSFHTIENKIHHAFESWVLAKNNILFRIRTNMLVPVCRVEDLSDSVVDFFQMMSVEPAFFFADRGIATFSVHWLWRYFFCYALVICLVCISCSFLDFGLSSNSICMLVGTLSKGQTAARVSFINIIIIVCICIVYGRPSRIR